jgi:hypothetical protein
MEERGGDISLQVAGPKGSLGRLGGAPLTSLRSDGKKERSWGAWGLKRSQDNQRGESSLPSTPQVAGPEGRLEEAWGAPLTAFGGWKEREGLGA